MLSMEDFESLRCLKTLLFLNFFSKDLRVEELPFCFLPTWNLSPSTSLSPLSLTNNKGKNKNHKGEYYPVYKTLCVYHAVHRVPNSTRDPASLNGVQERGWKNKDSL